MTHRAFWIRFLESAVQKLKDDEECKIECESILEKLYSYEEVPESELKAKREDFETVCRILNKTW